MRKWEYAVIFFIDESMEKEADYKHGDILLRADGELRVLAHADVPNIGKELQKQLNKLGREGWEAYSHLINYYELKREI